MLDQLIRYYADHQPTSPPTGWRNERAHILRAWLRALDALDEVIALIRASETVDIARAGLIEPSDIDEIQAPGNPGHGWPHWNASASSKTWPKSRPRSPIWKTSWQNPSGSVGIVRDELPKSWTGTATSSRPTETSHEDLIAREDVVVTITETGYAAHQDRFVSQPETRRQGRAVEAGRHRRSTSVSPTI